ncbi:MAG: DUF1214 domain-containing protein [Sphingobium sp.]
MSQEQNGGQAVWRAFVDALAEAGSDVYRAADPGRTLDEQTQVTQAMVWDLVGELQSLANLDRDHPTWTSLLNGASRRFNANADATYAVAYIRGSGTYRVSGRRGTTKMMYLQVGTGILGVGNLDRHTMLGDLNIDDCEMSADGRFEVILSAERPEGYTGTWMQLDASRDDSFAWVRQVSYDWLNEVDGQLSIQRIDRPIRKKDPTPDEYASNLLFAASMVRDDMLAMFRMMNQQIEGVEVNRFVDVSESFGSAGIVGQAYTHGVIQVAEDEAWVAECTIPEGCPYWSVQLMDYAYSALDAMYMQSSLNGHTAIPDPDGVIRIVVCANDPGAANWLDTAGQKRVQIRFRWLATAAPAIATKVVRLEELDRVMPADTARVTATERQDALRKRAIGLQWRRR